MPTNSKFSIFWMPPTKYQPSPPAAADTLWTESDITRYNKIEIERIDPDASSFPDALTGLVSIEPIISRTRTKNAAPFSDESRMPDTGFSGVRLMVKLFFDESTIHNGIVQKSKAIQRLTYWYVNRNTKRGIWREGRLGIRCDYRDEFDLVPEYDSGYKLVEFRLMQELKYNPAPSGYLVLEHSGDPRKLKGPVRETALRVARGLDV